MIIINHQRPTKWPVHKPESPPVRDRTAATIRLGNVGLAVETAETAPQAADSLIRT